MKTKPTGSARLTHGGRVCTITVQAKKGPRKTVYAILWMPGAVQFIKEDNSIETVTSDGCTCKSFQFRHVCKHERVARALGLWEKKVS